MSYIRKRALLACDFCRHRKRRCTGEQPCSTCVESNAECHYKELPVDRIESPSAPSDALSDRLGRIEHLLEDQRHELRRQGLQLHNLTVGSRGDGGLSSAVPYDTAWRARTRSPGEGRILLSSPQYDAHGFPSLRTSYITNPAAAAPPPSLSLSSSTSPVPIVLVPPEPTTTSSDDAHVPLSVFGQRPHAVSGGSTASASLSIPLPALLRRPQHLSPPPPPPPPAGFTQPQTPYATAYTNLSATSQLGASLSSVTGSATGSSPYTYDHAYAPYFPRQQSQHSSQEQDDENERYPFLIPLDHSTAANTLLSLPLVRYILTQQHRSLAGLERRDDDNSGEESFDHSTHELLPSFAYNRTYFFDIEKAHPLPPLLELGSDIAGLTDLAVPPASTSTSTPGGLHFWWPPAPLRASLTAAYFTRVHPTAPLFGRAAFHQWDAAEQQAQQDSRSTGTTLTVRTAVCLAVWALGALAGGGSGVAEDDNSRDQASYDQLALSLFQPALKILLHYALWEFGPATLRIAQTLMLAASFFSHMGRPLHNARLVYLANRHLLRQLEEEKRQGREPHPDDDAVRVFWIGFVLECDRAAELDVPRSGVEPHADHMPLPSSLDPHDTHESDDMICFVAETAVRRLLNRIHSSLYSSSSLSSSLSSSSLSSMATRLNNESPLAAALATATTERAAHSNSGSITTPGSKRKHRHDSDSQGAKIHSIATAASPQIPPPPPPLPPTHSSIAKMLSISAELRRQLEAWYQTIPQPLRPPLLDAEAVLAAHADPALSPPTASGSNERVQLLRVHYYAALHMIYRPSVLHVAWQQMTATTAPTKRTGRSSGPRPSEDDDNEILGGYDTDDSTDDESSNDNDDSDYSDNGDDNNDNDDNNDSDDSNNRNDDNSNDGGRAPTAFLLDHCAVCVDACAAYIVHVLPLLARRSPYLWSLCQGSLACLLVLLVADACPAIVARRRYRQHRRQQKKRNAAKLNLGWLCDQVAGQLRRWATPGSSLAAELAIVEQLPVRRADSGQPGKAGKASRTSEKKTHDGPARKRPKAAGGKQRNI